MAARRPRNPTASQRRAAITKQKIASTRDPLKKLDLLQTQQEQLSRPVPRGGDWVPIASSRVAHAQYRPKDKVLNVVFRDNTPWHYLGITQAQWRRLLATDSPGRYINTLTDHALSHGRGFA